MEMGSNMGFGYEDADMELKLQRREMIEEVLEAIGSGKRLATIEQISAGVPGKEIHKNIDASRSGVQHFISDFKDSGLITDPKAGQYELTNKGEVVVTMLSELDDEFAQFEREAFRGFAHNSSLSIEEMKQMLEEAENKRED